MLIEETHAVARSSVRPAAKKVLVGGVIKNPLAGSETTDDDLSALIALGEEVGDVLGKRGALALGGPVAAYGKAVIVGTAGQLEHGAAVLHPLYGKTVRAAIGHGTDIMPSTKRIGAAGCGIDVPIHNKDNGTSGRNFIRKAIIHFPCIPGYKTESKRGRETKRQRRCSSHSF